MKARTFFKTMLIGIGVIGLYFLSYAITDVRGARIDMSEVTTTNVSMQILDYEATQSDIRKTFGILPGFMLMYPHTALPGAWSEMKSVQASSNTAIPNKYKELIGLGVSAQIPCEYCIYMHVEMAKLNGATDAEISEAVAIAGITRKWSANLYGNRMDMDDFEDDVEEMVEYFTDEDNAKRPYNFFNGNTIEQVTADMKRTLGFEPDYFKALSREALVGSWKVFKNLENNPNSAIPGKYKSLISLAVASQIPCEYCSMADSQFAMASGASGRELKEAVAMAGIVRHWSTFLNGIQYDKAKFKNEVNQIVRYVKREQAKTKSLAKN